MSAWWRAWAGQAGLDASTTDAGELCLNEAVANIVVHGRANGGSHAIAVTLEGSSDAAQMTIVDRGAAFDPLEFPEPEVFRSLDDAPIGGLGIHLIRTF